MRRWIAAIATVALVLTVGGLAVAAQNQDFGAWVQQQLEGQHTSLFGVGTPLTQSSTASVSAADANADPTKLVTLAGGLQARVVTSDASAGGDLDQIALWPNDTNPQYLIECNEESAADPGLQRIDIATGAVATIVTGTTRCDPVRRTAWGTILFGEENGGAGRLFELLDPVATTDATLASPNIADRSSSVGNVSFEGLALAPNGLLYYGDELRPGDLGPGSPGGAYYKFVPTTPYTGSAPITDLSQSPLANGSIYGLRVGVHGTAPGTDYGQGIQDGFGTWVPVTGPNLRAQQAATHLTGYYRPEDAEVDPAALANGNVRFCGNNTGNETGRFYGETICVTDGTLSDALGGNTTTPEVQQFVEGNPALAMPDNLAFQPGSNNVILHEDADTTYQNNPSIPGGHNDDLWDCLPDGSDNDLLTDGCIRVGTLNDLHGGDGAEWTGGIFDASGKHFYVSVQHNVTGHGVILDITGWKVSK